MSISNWMTRKDDAKKAVEKYNTAKQLYERIVESIQQYALSLFRKREEILDEIISLYKNMLQIQDIPEYFIKQIEIQLKEQRIKRISFSDNHTMHFEKPSSNDESSEAWKYMFGAAAGIGVGGAVAGGSILTALATTFGIASSGAAISTLSGAAATNAVLAWIGGGAIAAGGGGIALGSTILGLMGPVGWGVASISIISGGLWQRSKNNKIIADYQKVTKEYRHHTDIFRNKISEICFLYEETDKNLCRLKEYSSICFPKEYSTFSESEKLEFSKMVSVVLASLRHLNKAVV